MATPKVRYTLWMDAEVLKAARARASEQGVAPSRVIVAAARTILIDNPQNTEERVLQAVERVFTLLQRIDRRRGYDQQVLKEMVGLMALSFFNHTPAIPEKDKKAALHSGKARFNRFLDTLAANLRASQSILNDLPAAEEPAMPERMIAISGSIDSEAPAFSESSNGRPSSPEANSKPSAEQPRLSSATQDKPARVSPQPRLTLFG